MCGIAQLLRRWEQVLGENFDTATVFKGTSSFMQNDLILVNWLKTSLYNKLKKLIFLATVLDKTSNIKSISQFSTVLRYVDECNNCIKEIFIKFHNVSADRTADELDGVHPM